MPLKLKFALYIAGGLAPVSWSASGLITSPMKSHSLFLTIVVFKHSHTSSEAETACQKVGGYFIITSGIGY